MKRLMLAALLAALMPTAPAAAQMIGSRDPAEGGKAWPGREAGVAGYRVYRKRGEMTEVEKVVEKKPWYHLTDRSGKKTSQLIDSVERIEPILQADLDRAAAELKARIEEDERQERLRFEQAEAARKAKEADLQRARDSARLEARTGARTEARTEAAGGSYSSGSSSSGGSSSSYRSSSSTSGREKTVHVREYTRRDGTHVRAHTRSAPRR